MFSLQCMDVYFTLFLYFRWNTVHVTMQGHSVWWSAIRGPCISEVSIRKEREEKQVSAGWDIGRGGGWGHSN